MTLRYLLDTNICIYIAKQKPLGVLRRFEKMAVGEVGMSLISYGELLFGAEKSTQSKQSQRILEELSTVIPPIALSIEVSANYAAIRALLEKKGQPIGNNDLWIAAHAVTLGVILVTHNLKEFTPIPHLSVEDWVDVA